MTVELNKRRELMDGCCSSCWSVHHYIQIYTCFANQCLAPLGSLVFVYTNIEHGPFNKKSKKQSLATQFKEKICCVIMCLFVSTIRKVAGLFPSSSPRPVPTGRILSAFERRNDTPFTGAEGSLPPDGRGELLHHPWRCRSRRIPWRSPCGWTMDGHKDFI